MIFNLILMIKIVLGRMDVLTLNIFGTDVKQIVNDKLVALC